MVQCISIWIQSTFLLFKKRYIVDASKGVSTFELAHLWTEKRLMAASCVLLHCKDGIDPIDLLAKVMVLFHGMKNLDKTKTKIKAATLQGSKHPSSTSTLQVLMISWTILPLCPGTMIQDWKSHHSWVPYPKIVPICFLNLWCPLILIITSCQSWSVMTLEDPEEYNDDISEEVHLIELDDWEREIFH